jgi:hypothetical protein
MSCPVAPLEWCEDPGPPSAALTTELDTANLRILHNVAAAHHQVRSMMTTTQGSGRQDIGYSRLRTKCAPPYMWVHARAHLGLGSHRSSASRMTAPPSPPQPPSAMILSGRGRYVDEHPEPPAWHHSLTARQNLAAMQWAVKHMIMVSTQGVNKSTRDVIGRSRCIAQETAVTYDSSGHLRIGDRFVICFACCRQQVSARHELTYAALGNQHGTFVELMVLASLFCVPSVNLEPSLSARWRGCLQEALAC